MTTLATLGLWMLLIGFIVSAFMVRPFLTSAVIIFVFVAMVFPIQVAIIFGIIIASLVALYYMDI